MVDLFGELWRLTTEHGELVTIAFWAAVAAVIASDREHPASRPMAIAVLVGALIVGPIWRRVGVDLPWYFGLMVVVAGCYGAYRFCSFFFDSHRIARSEMIKSPKYREAVRAFDRRSYAQAFQEFEEWAKAGDACAQYNLGVFCETGVIGRRDDARAESWYRAAAAQGLAIAQFELAKILVSDQMRNAASSEIPESERLFVEAHMWLTLAAVSGVGSGKP